MAGVDKQPNYAAVLGLSTIHFPHYLVNELRNAGSVPNQAVKFFIQPRGKGSQDSGFRRIDGWPSEKSPILKRYPQRSKDGFRES